MFVVSNIEDEVSGPRWIEADIAMAVAVRAAGLCRGVEALAEVVSASTGFDNAQPTDLFYQAVLVLRFECCGELGREGRPDLAEEVELLVAWIPQTLEPRFLLGQPTGWGYDHSHQRSNLIT
jgi:hypothetical protein